MTLKRVVIRRAHVTETVEIQWVREDGSVFYERHTCPPITVQEARMAEEAASGLVSWGDTREKAD